MGATLRQKDMKLILNRIKTHALSKIKEEVCGFIVEVNDQLFVKECKNVSSTPDLKFEIHPEAYLDAKLNSDILAIYHSHPNDSSFSEADKIISRMNCLPNVLYINSKDKFEAYYPDLCKKYRIDKIKELING